MKIPSGSLTLCTEGVAYGGLLVIREKVNDGWDDTPLCFEPCSSTECDLITALNCISEGGQDECFPSGDQYMVFHISFEKAGIFILDGGNLDLGSGADYTVDPFSWTNKTSPASYCLAADSPPTGTNNPHAWSSDDLSKVTNAFKIYFTDFITGKVGYTTTLILMSIGFSFPTWQSVPVSENLAPVQRYLGKQMFGIEMDVTTVLCGFSAVNQPLAGELEIPILPFLHAYTLPTSNRPVFLRSDCSEFFAENGTWTGGNTYTANFSIENSSGKTLNGGAAIFVNSRSNSTVLLNTPNFGSGSIILVTVAFYTAVEENNCLPALEIMDSNHALIMTSEFGPSTYVDSMYSNNATMAGLPVDLHGAVVIHRKMVRHSEGRYYQLNYHRCGEGLTGWWVGNYAPFLEGLVSETAHAQCRFGEKGSSVQRSLTLLNSAAYHGQKQGLTSVSSLLIFVPVLSTFLEASEVEKAFKALEREIEHEEEELALDMDTLSYFISSNAQLLTERPGFLQFTSALTSIGGSAETLQYEQDNFFNMAQTLSVNGTYLVQGSTYKVVDPAPLLSLMSVVTCPKYGPYIGQPGEITPAICAPPSVNSTPAALKGCWSFSCDEQGNLIDASACSYLSMPNISAQIDYLAEEGDFSIGYTGHNIDGLINFRSELSASVNGLPSMGDIAKAIESAGEEAGSVAEAVANDAVKDSTKLFSGLSLGNFFKDLFYLFIIAVICLGGYLLYKWYSAQKNHEHTSTLPISGEPSTDFVTIQGSTRGTSDVRQSFGLDNPDEIGLQPSEVITIPPPTHRRVPSSVKGTPVYLSSAKKSKKLPVKVIDLSRLPTTQPN